MTATPRERLVGVFVDLARSLVDGYDVIEFLRAVTAHTSQLVDARATGLLLADRRGRLRLTAASDERAEMLELFQVQAFEGPGQDCLRDGMPVVAADLRAAEDRWPRFAPRAVDSGFRSVYAIPMRLRQEVIGTMSLFGELPAVLAPDEVRIVQGLADIATIGLLHGSDNRRSEILAEQLRSALETRMTVNRATGSLAQRYGISTAAAFEHLRRYAQAHHCHLGEAAQEFVNDVSDDHLDDSDATTPSSAEF